MMRVQKCERHEAAVRKSKQKMNEKTLKKMNEKKNSWMRQSDYCDDWVTDFSIHSQHCSSASKQSYDPFLASCPAILPAFHLLLHVAHHRLGLSVRVTVAVMLCFSSLLLLLHCSSETS